MTMSRVVGGGGLHLYDNDELVTCEFNDYTVSTSRAYMEVEHGK